MIDYRHILKVYARYVMDSEGWHCLDNGTRLWSGLDEEQSVAMREIRAEIESEEKRDNE